MEWSRNSELFNHNADDTSITLKRYKVKTGNVPIFKTTKFSLNRSTRKKNRGNASEKAESEEGRTNAKSAKNHRSGVEISRGKNYLESDDAALDLPNHEGMTKSWTSNYESRKKAWGSLKESDKNFIEMSRDNGKTSQLHQAALRNNHEVLSYLLDTGANPNVRAGCEGLTPLHVSVR